MLSLLLLLQLLCCCVEEGVVAGCERFQRCAVVALSFDFFFAADDDYQVCQRYSRTSVTLNTQPTLLTSLFPSSQL
jgi:hypothetical protein